MLRKILFLIFSCYLAPILVVIAHESGRQPVSQQTTQPQQATRQQATQTDMPTAPGAYYESEQGFIPLEDFSPFMLMQKESRSRAPLVPNAGLSFIIIYPNGDSQIEHLRLLRSSRMVFTMGFTFDDSGSRGISDLGGDPQKADSVEPIEGRPGAYRVKIKGKLKGDLYLFASTYSDMSKPKTSVVQLHGCFRVK